MVACNVRSRKCVLVLAASINIWNFFLLDVCACIFSMEHLPSSLRGVDNLLLHIYKNCTKYECEHKIYICIAAQVHI